GPPSRSQEHRHRAHRLGDHDRRVRPHLRGRAAVHRL
ncbi:MAG: hypothetical protein AVDCRST_MAG38-990, partial [uncultured Solirubrobacteraceae bacterium]